MPTPLWHIEMLGRFRLVRGDQSVTRFRTTKSALLLARLACFPRQAHSREQLSDLFWPDADLPTGRNRLKQEIATLRRMLEPPDVESGTVLCADRLSISLNRGTFTTDVGEFEMLLALTRQSDKTTSNRHRQADNAPDANARVERLKRGVELYAGELLPGYYEDWVLTERERLARLYLRSLRELAACHAEAGHQEQAIELLLCAINAAPLEGGSDCRSDAPASCDRAVVGSRTTVSRMGGAGGRKWFAPFSKLARPGDHMFISFPTLFRYFEIVVCSGSISVFVPSNSRYERADQTHRLFRSGSAYTSGRAE